MADTIAPSRSARPCLEPSPLATWRSGDLPWIRARLAMRWTGCGPRLRAWSVHLFRSCCCWAC